MNRKRGSISVAAIIILSIIMIISNSVHSRFISSSKSLKSYTESENLTRRAEGTAIIAKDKVLEATKVLYDSCNNKEELKAKIEGPYKREYFRYIEKRDDIGIKGAVIDVLDDNMEQNGADLYRFRIKCVAYENGMEKYVTINVSLKNIMKSKEAEKENTSADKDNSSGNISNSTEVVGGEYNINDAVEFRIVRYN